VPNTSKVKKGGITHTFGLTRKNTYKNFGTKPKSKSVIQKKKHGTSRKILKKNVLYLLIILKLKLEINANAHYQLTIKKMKIN